MAPLGKIAGDVLRELGSIDAFLDDPITRSSSCGDELAPGMYRRSLVRVEELLRSEGFSSYDEFVDAVRDRTSDRWVYDACLVGAGDDLGGPFYTERSSR